MNMKRFFSIVMAVGIVSAFWGCDSFAKLSDSGKTSQGAPYELVVVSNNQVWDGIVGDTLRSILRQPVPSINQYEPLFDVMRVTPDGFKNVIARHRNILKLLVDSKVTEPAIGVKYDVSASPQIMIVAQGPNEQSLADYISANRDNLLYVLEKAERDRTVDYAEKYNVASLHEAIMEKFGVSMNVPKGYTLRSASDHFMWISYEFPSASQGFFLYSYPYEGPQSLSLGALVDARNRFAARIPGPSDGSYMITYMDYEPDYKMIRIGDRLWVEMRGLWDVANDFMGGPFVSYSTVNTETNEVFTLDCYVYSPKLDKRNFLRALEHLVYVIEFPSDGDPEK